MCSSMKTKSCPKCPFWGILSMAGINTRIVLKEVMGRKGKSSVSRKIVTRNLHKLLSGGENQARFTLELIENHYTSNPWNLSWWLSEDKRIEELPAKYVLFPEDI